MIGPILFIGAALNIKKITYDTTNVFLLCYSVPVVIIVFVDKDLFILRIRIDYSLITFRDYTLLK